MRQKKTHQTLPRVCFFFFSFSHTVLCTKVSLHPQEPLSMHSKTCIPFHYKQEIQSSRKTPCGGYTLSVIALTSVAHNESLKCERLKMQKDRRRPDTCHPFHPEVSAPLTHTHTHTHTDSSLLQYFHNVSPANSAFVFY